MQDIIQEAKIVSLVKSEHTVQQYQTIKTSTKIYMLQEYANCFDLATLIAVRGSLSQNEARLIMRQIVKGINDIHKCNIIHRDLKLANMLIHFPTKP